MLTPISNTTEGVTFLRNAGDYMMLKPIRPQDEKSKKLTINNGYRCGSGSGLIRVTVPTTEKTEENDKNTQDSTVVTPKRDSNRVPSEHISEELSLEETWSLKSNSKY
jgi:hypothetical protein